MTVDYYALYQVNNYFALFFKKKRLKLKFAGLLPLEYSIV